MATDDPVREPDPNLLPDEPSGPSDRGERGTIPGQIVTGVATAAILGACSLAWQKLTGQQPRAVLFVLSGIGLAAGLASLLTLTIVIWRWVGRPPRWFALAMAVTLSTLIVSVSAGTAAVAFVHDATTATTTMTTTTSEPPPATHGNGDTERAGGTTTTTAPACASPPIRLAKLEPADPDFVDVEITISCPAPGGRTYYLISQVDDVDPRNPHAEYYVREDSPLDGLETATFRWMFDRDPPGLHRRLYVVAVTPEQEVELKHYYDPVKHLVLQLPAGLAPSSNTLEHTKE